MSQAPEQPQESRGGPPPATKASRFTAMPKDLLERTAGMVRGLLGMGARAREQVDEIAAQASPAATARPVAEPQAVYADPASTPDAWFGPGHVAPPAVQVPAREVAGRAFDYASNVNLNRQVKVAEGTSFAQLRQLADGYDLLRLAIETRKDQVAKLGWSILPRKRPDSQFRPKSDDRCAEIEARLRKPDGVHHWDQWIRNFCEELFVLDAAALYRRRTVGGDPYALEIVDGSLIQPLIDATGRRPLSPQPAFRQILKGVDPIHYTSDELTYVRRNVRANKLYGYSPVEQVITYVTIGLSRMKVQLEHFTEGTIPEALVAVPPEWTGSQIREFQADWDAMMSGESTVKRRMRFVPAGVTPMMLHPDGGMTDQFDEWLARIICYCFSLPPLPFVRQQNRATAETAEDTALAEGLAPWMVTIKNTIDGEIGEFYGAPDLELVWDDIRKLDPTEQNAQDQADMRSGIIGLDDIRARRGMEPTGVPPMIWGIGPMGFLTHDQLKQIIAQGLNMPVPQMPVDGMGLPGQPQGAPGGDPLAGADPQLLAELGLSGAQANAAATGQPPDEPEGEPITPPSPILGLTAMKPGAGDLAAFRHDPGAHPNTLRAMRVLGSRPEQQQAGPMMTGRSLRPIGQGDIAALRASPKAHPATLTAIKAIERRSAHHHGR